MGILIETNGRTQTACNAGILAVALCLAAPAAAAAEYPDHAIRIIQPFPVGGASDIEVRKVADHMQQSLNQPIIVDNRPGASGIIAVQAVATSKPDGYTIAFGTQGTHVTNRLLFSDLPYDPVKDFVPIGQYWQSETMLAVSAQLPIKTVHDLIDYAKSHPGDVKFGSTGEGTNPHLTAVQFATATGVKLTHVPYSNIGNAFQDLTAGRLTMMFYPFGALKPLIDSGAVRILGTSDSKRVPVAPNIPTVAEGGVPGFAVTNWNGFFAPKGTPDTAIQVLFKAISDGVNAPDTRSYIESGGDTIVITDGPALTKVMEDDAIRLGKIVAETGAKVR